MGKGNLDRKRYSLCCHVTPPPRPGYFGHKISLLSAFYRDVSVAKYRGSLATEGLEGDDLQECAEREEQHREEDHSTGAGLGGSVAGKETVGHASGHEKEGLLLRYREEDDAGGQKQSALQAA